MVLEQTVQQSIESMRYNRGVIRDASLRVARSSLGNRDEDLSELLFCFFVFLFFVTTSPQSGESERFQLMHKHDITMIGKFFRIFLFRICKFVYSLCPSHVTLSQYDGSTFLQKQKHQMQCSVLIHIQYTYSFNRIIKQQTTIKKTHALIISASILFSYPMISTLNYVVNLKYQTEWNAADWFKYIHELEFITLILAIDLVFST